MSNPAPIYNAEPNPNQVCVFGGDVSRSDPEYERIGLTLPVTLPLPLPLPLTLTLTLSLTLTLTLTLA